jgi:hypothetical protein
MAGDRVITNIGPPAQTRSVSGGSAGWSSVAMRTMIWCSAACLMASGDASAATPSAPPSAREPGQEDGEGVGDLRLVVDEDLGGAMQLASGQA